MAWLSFECHPSRWLLVPIPVMLSYCDHNSIGKRASVSSTQVVVIVLETVDLLVGYFSSRSSSIRGALDWVAWEAEQVRARVPTCRVLGLPCKERWAPRSYTFLHNAFENWKRQPRVQALFKTSWTAAIVADSKSMQTVCDWNCIPYLIPVSDTNIGGSANTFPESLSVAVRWSWTT